MRPTNFSMPIKYDFSITWSPASQPSQPATQQLILSRPVIGCMQHVDKGASHSILLYIPICGGPGQTELTGWSMRTEDWGVVVRPDDKPPPILTPILCSVPWKGDFSSSSFYWENPIAAADHRFHFSNFLFINRNCKLININRIIHKQKVISRRDVRPKYFVVGFCFLSEWISLGLLGFTFTRSAVTVVGPPGCVVRVRITFIRMIIILCVRHTDYGHGWLFDRPVSGCKGYDFF